MRVTHASRTAVLVCQGRAVAHGRIAIGRFDDRTAMQILTDAERVPVERVRSGLVPNSARERVEFEMVKACGELMVPRTIGIDDAVRERANTQLVDLGAGLDGRAWRMTDLGSVEVFEVDHPASQDDKRDRVGSLQTVARAVTFVPVDFGRDDLDEALDSAGHQRSVATTWIWEGVVPYLTVAEVESTLRIVDRRSAPGSRLIVNYQQPSVVAAVARLFARALNAVARQPDPLTNEPRRSAWTAASMGDLLQRHHWTVVRDGDLVTVAQAEHIDVTRRLSLRDSRLAIADR